eukprot:gene5431-9244_t
MSHNLKDKYLKTHVFHDEKSNFTLNLSGIESLDNLESVLHQYRYSVEHALQKFEDIENGKIVNKTCVKEESENRSVDHYNLRSKVEKVKGKSLKHSIEYWKEIQKSISKILEGEVKNENKEKYTDVVFNGIGGSYLGPLMLLVANKGMDYNFNSDLPMRMHFIANTDPDSFKLLLDKLNLKTTLMVNMSKSGSTAETKGNMDSFNEQLEKLNLPKGSHNIAITTPDSKFDKYAKEHKFMNIFYMNNETGGRMSVCSAIGMVPCAFAKLNFEEFLNGQSHMDDLCRRKDTKQNPAMLVGIAIDKMTKTFGRKNMIVLGYSDFLKEFAHYLQQLYMESLGKEFNEIGTPNAEGQSVFGGIGTGEQHAFMQQIQKGVADAFVRFVYFIKRKNDFKNEKSGSMGRQLLAFVKGTEDALITNGKPFISSAFEECSMFNLGMMVSMEENIVSILAAFRNINAYDQPGVQDGKLAADQMNFVSKKIEEIILKLDKDFEGDASDAQKQFDLEKEPIFFVDAVLTDIYANYEQQLGYKFENKSIKRSWKDGRFIYAIKIQLLKESEVDGSRVRERERETREEAELSSYLRQIDEMEQRERELNPQIVERENIIRDQDRAYQEMVERDRQMQMEEEKKKEEEKRKEAEEKLKQEKKKKEIEERREKLKLKYQLEPNPDFEDDLIKIIFKFEVKRIQRYFRKEDTFEDLFEFLDINQVNVDKCQLVIQFPPAKFTLEKNKFEKICQYIKDSSQVFLVREEEKED